MIEKKKVEENVVNEALPTIEERLEIVNQIVEDLEGEVSLEDSYQLYEQGVKQLKQCMESINLVEKKMLLLTEEGEFKEY